MSKLKIVVSAFFLLTLHFSVGAALAGVALYDPDLANSGTTLVEFSGQFQVGINAQWSGVNSVKINDIGPQWPLTINSSGPFSGSYTYGYPYDGSGTNNFARSTIDFTNSSISSQLQYSSTFDGSNSSNIFIYTKALPSSYSLSGGGSLASTPYSANLQITIFDSVSRTSLGWFVISRQGDQYRKETVNGSEWFYAPPDQSALLTYVNSIVNGQSSDFYYFIGATVSSTNSNYYTDGYANATLNFGNNTPVPIPAAVWLLGSGLIGLFGIRRFRK